jgi:hypothetical protein
MIPVFSRSEDCLLIKCPENPSKTLIFSISFFAAVKSFGIIS